MSNDGDILQVERPFMPLAEDFDDYSDIVILSIGVATPRSVSIVAEVLRLPSEFVVDTIYRAPARLLARLKQADAVRLTEMLQGIGLDAVAVQPGAVPPRGGVMDIAALLIDPARADEVARALGRFVGTSSAAALDLLLTPPGIVLGNVTQPTLDALRAALPGDAVALIASEPDTAHYAVFASELSAVQLAAVRHLVPADAGRQDDGTIACFDLTRIEADTLWRRLRAPEGVRIVNQDFLRFTLTLTAFPEDAAAGTRALKALAGVPGDAYAELATALPCPVVDGIGYRDLTARIGAFVEAGFGVRADLESFSTMALDIRSAAPEVLAEVGVTDTAPCVTPPMPRERARVLRARLESAGGEVWPL